MEIQTSASQLKFKDYEVWIDVEGQELRCYNAVEDDLNPAVSAWIASQAGKSFAVKIRMNRPTVRFTKATIYLDGLQIKPDLNLEKMGLHTFDSVKSLRKDQAKMPLMFEESSIRRLRPPTGRLTTGDGGKIRTVETPGTIRVEIKRQTKNLPLLLCRAKPRGREGQVQHHIRYGKPSNLIVGNPSQEMAPKKSSSQNAAMEVVATFTFNYRPIESLRAQGIVPRLNSPELASPRIESSRASPQTPTASPQASPSASPRASPQASPRPTTIGATRVQSSSLHKTVPLLPMKLRRSSRNHGCAGSRPLAAQPVASTSSNQNNERKRKRHSSTPNLSE